MILTLPLALCWALGPQAQGTSEIWDYLRKKYDANHDGAVSAQEYTRSAATFQRLDRNHDGRLDAEDFRHGRGGGQGGRDRATMMRQALAQRVTMACFQGDDDGDHLALKELQDSFARLDANHDGSLDRAEFAAVAARAPQPPRALGRQAPKPFAALLAVCDRDGDAELASTELVSFFLAMDDGDQVWTNPGARSRGGRGRGAERPPSGAPVGTLAPDFELQPPDGGPTVSLSSFRGKKAVALIFGSYT